MKRYENERVGGRSEGVIIREKDPWALEKEWGG